MQPKVLFVSHTTNFIKFNLPYMKWFRDQGWLVHYASAEEEPFPDDVCDAHFRISFQRSPYSADNIVAYKQIKELIDNQNYQIIHCHTPVGGAVTRLAARDARKRGTKVIYTAHGFHFYRGAPKRNWMLYYPVEKYLSRYTDCLVTINSEDYSIAQRNFYSPCMKIDGIGIDLNKFCPCSCVQEREKERIALGFSPDDFLLIYAGELNQNKNQFILIKSIKDICSQIPNVKLLLAGEGCEEQNYKQLVHNLGLSEHVIFLGYRNDIATLFRISDLCVASSIREGFGLNLVEAMASGLPLVASRNRGHTQIVHEGTNGFLFDLDDLDSLNKSIYMLYSDDVLYNKMSKQNTMDAQQYNVDKIVDIMGKTYRKFMEESTCLELV